MVKVFRFYILILMYTSLVGASCSYAQPHPDLILLDGKVLANNKKVLENGQDPVLTAALNVLLQKADKALMQGAYSVTKKQKSSLPEGVSLHDYYSLSSYWWPNSSTANGLPYKARDGKVNPERDKIPDRNEVINLCDDVYNLGLAYYFTEDERYAEKIVKQIEAFFLNEETKMLPNFEYSQFIPGNPNSGGATISALAFLKLIDGVQVIDSYKDWSESDKSKLKIWFSDFLNWMLTSEKGLKEGRSKNNIGTYYTVQVTAYALFINDRELAKRLFNSQAYNRIDEQIYKGGKMPHELQRATPYTYTSYNTEAFLKLSRLGDKLNEDIWAYSGKNGGSIATAYEQMKSFSTSKKSFRLGKQTVNPRNAAVAIARYADHVSTKQAADLEQEVDLKQIEVDSDTYYIWLTTVKF